MRLERLAVLGLLAGLAACASPGEESAARRDAQAIADAHRPGTMEVTGARSNMMRDRGFTVSLRYREDGYDFPVGLDMGPSGCRSGQDESCPASLDRQIALGREEGDIDRAVAPALAACDLDLEPTRVNLRTPSRNPASNNVLLELTSRTPLPDRGEQVPAAADACAAAVLAAHAAGPSPELPFSIRLALPPAQPFEPPVVEAEGELEAAFVAVYGTGGTSQLELSLPFRWRRALDLTLRDSANALLAERGVPVRAEATTMGVPYPRPANRAVVRVALFGYPEGTPRGGGAPYLVWLDHDMRSGTSSLVRVMDDFRTVDGRLDIDKINAVIAE